MNSIFSSFDAVCAEFLGQTVRGSVPSSNKHHGFIQSQQKQKREDANNKKVGNSSAPASAHIRKPEQRKGATARYAPELDGLHCFETLIFY